MKLTYITTYNAESITNWSGLGFYISKALTDQSILLEYLGGLETENLLLQKIKMRFYRHFQKKKYLPNRNHRVVKGYAKQIIKRIPDLTDIIFSPSSIPIALLETIKPIVFYTDAVFAGMLGYYPEFSNFCEETLKDGHLVEKAALERCQLAIYASDWAGEAAVNYYKIDPKKIKIVPFGANFSTNRSMVEIKNIINRRSSSKCKILFLGVDWYRKGGDIVLEAVKLLNKEGLKTELAVVGCSPVSSEPLPNFVKPFGFIDKSSPEGITKLNSLLVGSHFLFVPSIAEAYGVVYCEANSFGVPAIATNTGGIPTVIKDGINGMKFGLNAKPSEYAAYILDCFNNFNTYKELARSSFNEYESRLNWKVSGAKIKSLLKELL